MIPPEDRTQLAAYESDRRGFFDEPDIDEIKEEAYREAALHFLEKLNSALVFVAIAPNRELAIWQVAYGYGVRMTGGVSLTRRAREIGRTRAGISRGAKEFQRGMRLPMAEGMRDSALACANARQRQLV